MLAGIVRSSSRRVSALRFETRLQPSFLNFSNFLLFSSFARPVPVKRVLTAKKNKSIPTAAPTKSSAPAGLPRKKLKSTENVSLLSLVKPEDRSQIPILKSKISIDKTNETKYLNALRRCHLFPDALAFLTPSRVSNMVPSSLLETARLLVDSRLLGHPLPDDDVLLNALEKRRKEMKMPPTIGRTIDAYLLILLNEAAAVASCDSLLREVLHPKELALVLAVSALRTGQWHTFEKIMESHKLSIHQPVVMHWLLASDKFDANAVLDWYVEFILREDACVTDTDFENYTQRVFGLAGFTFRRVRVSRAGEIAACGVKLPREPPLTAVDRAEIAELRRNMMDFLRDLSKSAGSVLENEVKSLEWHVKSTWESSLARQKRGNNSELSAGSQPHSAVVIDALNLTHGKDARLLRNVVERLLTEYNNVMIVTRPFMKKILDKIDWTGNVRPIYVSSLSEDDLFVLAAALLWPVEGESQSARVVSNDQFTAHANRLPANSSLLLRKWLARNRIYIDRSERYDMPILEDLPHFDRRIHRLSDSMYFVPIIHPPSNQRSNSQFSYYVAEKKKK